eukprot:m.88500 g.88500  ORF g.88500 m.88500 type:complete len:221 (-) comp11652_c0_seq1:997-1659(-)
MTLKIYGIPHSQPARTVMWALAIHNVPFEVISARPGSNKPGGTRHPDYVAKFPTATIPAMDDGGFTLTESVAILRYLAAKHNWAEYYPSELKKRAKIDFFLEWHHRNSRELTVGLFAPIIRPDLGLAPNKSVGPRVLGALEGFLGADTTFLAGSSPTLADLVVYGDVGQCQSKYCGLADFEPYPNVRRWMANVESLPHFSENHKAVVQLGGVFRKMKAKM